MTQTTNHWFTAATWYNEELDRLAAEGLTPSEAQEPPSQSLLMHNVMAAHLKEFAIDPLLLVTMCKVFVKAGIPEPLITSTIGAFFQRYATNPQNN